MRPLQLRMQAFGPFPQEQRIDFRRLGDKTFFLIHGPTGSGKTSILDGLCFALFGDSSGGEREGRHMRSQHAAPGLRTEVEFEFALGERRYRVLRVPEQMRPALRGGGEVRQQPLAELHECLPEGGERPVAAGWSRVNEAVPELLGFDSRQFRQVIVLPQGRFFEFLKSSSQERERILQVLFGTAMYKRIEQSLKDAADQLQGQARELRGAREALLRQAGVDSEDALEERRAAQAERVSACEQAQAAAQARAAEADQALAAARQVAARFTELDQSQAGFEALDAQQPAFAQEQLRLDRMRRAAALRPWEAALQSAREALAGEQALAAQREQALAEAGARREVAAGALESLQRRAPELDALDQRWLMLQALGARVASLAEARSAQQAAQSRHAAAQSALEAARGQHAQALSTLEQCRQGLQALAADASGLEAAHMRGQQLAGLQAQLTQREALRTKLKQEEAAVRQRASERDAAQQVQARAAEARRALLQRWLAGQSARIAHSLRPGEACPVCGSHEHPAPAHEAAENVDDDALAAGEQAADRAQARFLEAERALAQARQRHASVQGEADAVAAALGDEAPDPQVLAQELVQLREVFAKARSAARRLADQQQALPVLQAQAQSADAQLQAAQAAAQQADGECQRAAGRLAEREQGVPAELAAPALLAAAREACGRDREALREALARAQQAAEAAAQALTRAQALREEGARGCAAREADMHRRREEFVQRLRDASPVDSRSRGNGETPGQPSDDELLAAYHAAKADDAVVGALEVRIHAFQQSLGTARERLARAQLQVKEQDRPALDALQHTQAEAQAAHLAAAQASTQARGELQATERLLATLDGQSKQYGDIEQRHALLRSLADMACGQNAQRMSFQRYVLATLLEEVLAATTLRLRVMSRGRYEMQRRREAADARAAGGLDLEVFDHHTGSTRGVDTLSGGESFLASLALALGLSDVVQSHAGGIRLDAIFIDEGFGTLDPEALDFAIRTLKDLQQAGRMVGIISHVAELREWMDARLELQASRSGSRAEFVL